MSDFISFVSSLQPWTKPPFFHKFPSNLIEDCWLPRQRKNEIDVQQDLISTTTTSNEFPQSPSLLCISFRQKPDQIRIVNGDENLFNKIKKRVEPLIRTSEEDDSVQEVSMENNDGVVVVDKKVRRKEIAWVWTLKRNVFHLDMGCIVLQRIVEAVMDSGYELLTSAELTRSTQLEFGSLLFKKAFAGRRSQSSYGLTEASNDEDDLRSGMMSIKFELINSDGKEKTPKSSSCNDNTAADDKKSINVIVIGEYPEERSNMCHEISNYINEKCCFPNYKFESCVDVSTLEPTVNFNCVNVRGPVENISSLILHLLEYLFAKQWKMIATSCMQFSRRNETLHFLKDCRILPGLGGSDKFTMIEIEKPDSIRMMNISDELEGRMIKVIEQFCGAVQPIDDEKSETEKRYKIANKPWVSNKKSSDEVDSKMPIVTRRFPNVNSEELFANLLLELSAHQQTLYCSMHLGRDDSSQSQRTIFVFKQSNLMYSQYLAIKLIGSNQIGIIGGTENDIRLVRKCLASIWPYRISRDYKVISKACPTNEMNNSDGGGGVSNMWMYFKVKHRPWKVSYCGNVTLNVVLRLAKNRIVSYGGDVVMKDAPKVKDESSSKSIENDEDENKDVGEVECEGEAPLNQSEDDTEQLEKGCARKTESGFEKTKKSCIKAISTYTNSTRDGDRAKTLILAVIKNLINEEWRLQAAVDISSELRPTPNIMGFTTSSVSAILGREPSDANTLFFLK